MTSRFLFWEPDTVPVIFLPLSIVVGGNFFYVYSLCSWLCGILVLTQNFPEKFSYVCECYAFFWGSIMVPSIFCDFRWSLVEKNICISLIVMGTRYFSLCPLFPKKNCCPYNFEIFWGPTDLLIRAALKKTFFLYEK